MTSNQWHVRLLLLAGTQALVSGASLVVEIVAGRILAPYVGMSLYTWTSVIAVVLAGFSAGHWYGGRIAERPLRNALGLTGFLMVAAAVSTAVAIQLLRLISGPVENAVTDPVWEIAILTLAVFFLPSFLAGIPAPVLANVAITANAGRTGQALGAMFAAGAIGAIGGTLFAGFLFIPWFGTASTLVIVTITYLFVAALLLGASGRLKRLSVLFVPVAVIVLGFGVFSATRLSPCNVESQYYCIRVIDVPANPADGPVRLMVLDHLSHGTSARNQPRLMYTEFTAMLDGIARLRMGDRRFSSFFIGGGTYSVPRSWVDRDTGPVTVAEIDPAVTAVAMRDFWFDPEDVEVLHQDARYALKKKAEVKYDVIVGDAFGDIAVPEHLVTREFFELVRARLNDDGLFLMNVVDFPEDLDALAAIHLTLRKVFPSVEIWTEAVPPVEGFQQVFVLAAGNEPSPFDSIVAPAPESKQFAALGDTFIEKVLGARSPEILTDDYSPVDRLLLRD